jgi:tetratricopeptide (TPR) repeat protein
MAGPQNPAIALSAECSKCGVTCQEVMMRKTAIFQALLPGRPRPRLAHSGFVVCGIIALIISGGCSSLNEAYQARPDFQEANLFFSQGNYRGSLDRYAQMLDKYPSAADRVLFEMGIIHAHPKNEQKDYGKALECFDKVITDDPESSYRKDSEMMTFYISNGIVKDNVISAKQSQIEALRRELKERDHEIAGLHAQIEALEQKFFAFAAQAGPVDKILIEKKARRLTLISKGEAIKTYRIALGGNPEGPKERQGDHKTPEGTYFIDAKNRNSQYHLSLRISYPNEADKKRALELGVSPGGDIMIHGIKNGLSWVGDAHASVDWTKGCIAVTDEEIQEIDKLAPVGTSVEIRP